MSRKKSIHIQGSATSCYEVNLQNSDGIVIKRQKFWQLVQWFMLVSVFVISITSLLVSVYIPYFLEISPHLEIPPPSKSRRIYLPPVRRLLYVLILWEASVVIVGVLTLVMD